MDSSPDLPPKGTTLGKSPDFDELVSSPVNWETILSPYRISVSVKLNKNTLWNASHSAN